MVAIKVCVLLFAMAVLVTVCESLPARDRRHVLVVPLIASPDRRFPEPSGGLLRESRDVSSVDYEDAEGSPAGGADMEVAATLVFRPLFVYRPRGRS